MPSMFPIFQPTKSGSQSADTFMAWMDVPANGNPVASKLIKAFANWFIATGDPNGLLGPPSLYALEADDYCLSIG